MARKNSGLGRGIDSIFLENALTDNTLSGGRSTVRISQLDAKGDQPRKNFDEESLAALAESIRLHGVLQPILVREAGIGRYQIVAGERRYRASKMAGLSEIPAIVIQGDDKNAAQIAMIENVQRENLNPLEEATGYRALMVDYGMTQEELAATVGKSRSAIANMLRLLDLPDELLDMVASGELTPGHARAVLSLVRTSDRLALADRILTAGLSVREAEELARRMNKRAAAEEKEDPDEKKELKVDYAAELEERVTRALGRRVKISATRKNKSVTLYYEDNEDLDALLRLLCGNEFTEEV